jgi:hypothetical protein
MKIVIHISPAATPIQVEVPATFAVKKGDDPKKAKKIARSVEGALHLRPGSTKTITEDELKFIQKTEKEYAANIRVIGKDADKKGAKKEPEKPVETPDSNAQSSLGSGADEVDPSVRSDKKGKHGKKPGK